jgi:hypothetical protein
MREREGRTFEESERKLKRHDFLEEFFAWRKELQQKGLGTHP